MVDNDMRVSRLSLSMQMERKMTGNSKESLRTLSLLPAKRILNFKEYKSLQDEKKMCRETLSVASLFGLREGTPETCQND